MKFRKLADEPTQEEIDEHNLNHANFREWCPHCIKGKAKSFPHRKSISKAVDIPIISIDYAFMNDDKDKNEDQEKGMPIVLLIDKETKIRRARVVPKKGVEPYAVGRIRKGLEQLGHKKILFKSDREHSINALKQAIKTAQKSTLAWKRVQWQSINQTVQ